MLSVDGDADAVVEATVRKASNKFRHPVPWLTCVHSCMLNDSEA